MDPSGFEPEASALQGQRSTVELRAPGRAKTVYLRNLIMSIKKRKGGDPAAGSPTATL